MHVDTQDRQVRLTEDDPIRGNTEFIYSHHKRIIEEMLAAYRSEHPELIQLIFRIGTILGASTDNQITKLFDSRVILGIRGTSAPFVFIWDEDVVGCLVKGVRTGQGGIFNVAGDGTVSLRAVAARQKKPYVSVPPGVVRIALALLKRAGLSPYGPEQVNFLRYRPVLANDRLKRDFGYVPRLTSEKVFDLYLKGREVRTGV